MTLFNKDKRKFLKRIKDIKKEIKSNNNKIAVLEGKCFGAHCRAWEQVRGIEIQNHLLDLKLILLEAQLEARKITNEWY